MTALPRQDTLLDVPPGQDVESVGDGATDGRRTSRYEAAPEVAAPKPVRVKSKAESERDGVKAIYLQVVGRPYAAVPQDHAAWTELKKVGTIAEIEEFWRFSLSKPTTDWLHAPTIWQLKRKWNDIATVLAKSRPADLGLGPCAACGGHGECAMWELPVCYRCYSAWLEEPAPDYAQAHAAVRTWARERLKSMRAQLEAT